MPVEVSPVRKHARIEENNLILKQSDGSRTTIPLKGCVIEAVSATNLPSRKWAKRFPIKVESKTSLIYNGSKIIYLYLETSWEKESWCKALRIASCEDKEKLNWFSKLNADFLAYLTSLNAGYPSFMKPSLGFSAEPVDKGSRFDVSSSKVRLFWRRLSRKTAKPGIENKGILSYQSAREEKKACEKQHPFQDSVTNKVPNSSTEENMALPLPQGFSRSASQSCTSVASDTDSDQDKLNFDEGTLCWNLLISRIFFDIKGNSGLKSSIQTRIQRTLSNIRTSGYIGEVICTGIDVGNLPPYIHAMRLLATDMNEVWAFEVDAEYSGGIVLDVETRLEVRDQDFQKGIVDTNSESNSVENVSSDLLEGFEHFGKHLNLPEADMVDPKVDGLKGLKATSTTCMSRWKSVINSIAQQVSQVPLSLSIRVASLRGTLRLYIKPPPSDQLWFGFTSMPEIDFHLESSIGEHKITSGHIALFLISRFKAAIRETMVLPNCESACIPFMLAEKDDWVPRKVAPYIWLNQEAVADNNIVREGLGPQLTESKAKENSSRASSSNPESKHLKPNVDSVQPPAIEPVAMPSSSPAVSSSARSMSLQDLKTPLLETDEPHETCQQNREATSDSKSLSRSLTEFDRQSDVMDENDSRPKKVGRRARMLDLGKKMGEKLEEKRRHIEEKSRHIVEKMRGP
ncbi:hypothetical protein PTKIN_Ptkin13bG0154600 [Pterospermum kingtungense]